MPSRECCNLIRNSFSTFSFLVLLLTLTETEKEGGSQWGSLLSWSDFDFVCAIDTFKRKWRQSDTNTGSDEKKCKENPEKKLNFRWKFWKEKQKEENGILGNLQRRKGEVSLFINEPNVDTRPTEAFDLQSYPRSSSRSGSIDPHPARTHWTLNSDRNDT